MNSCLIKKSNRQALLRDSIRLDFIKYENRFKGTHPYTVIKSPLWQSLFFRDGHIQVQFEAYERVNVIQAYYSAYKGSLLTNSIEIAG